MPRQRPTAGRRTGRYTQTERVFELLTRLRARRTPARLDALAEELAVSVKQLRRDLAALGAIGHTTELVRLDGRSAVRLVPGKHEPITLTFRERITLLAIRDLFTALGGTPLAEDAQSIFDKVLATLPDDTARDVSRLGARFRYLPDGGLKSYADRADVVDALLTATVHRHAVDATYRSHKGRLRTGRFEPWGLALHKNGLYAVGRFDAGASPMVLAVERFETAERRRTARFEIPDDFSLESFFDGAFGVFVGSPVEHVVLEFHANVRALVTARLWHRTQDTAVLPDGRVRMQLDVGTSPDLVAWLVGWGPMVRVIEPDHLAERVRTEHRRSVKRNRGGANV